MTIIYDNLMTADEVKRYASPQLQRWISLDRQKSILGSRLAKHPNPTAIWGGGAIALTRHLHRPTAATVLGVAEDEIESSCRNGLLKHYRTAGGVFVLYESLCYYGLHIGRVLPFFPAQALAWKCMRMAIRDGTLKLLPCEVCGDPKAGGHHDNYTRPLDVRWLCHKHHREFHAAKNREAASW